MVMEKRGCYCARFLKGRRIVKKDLIKSELLYISARTVIELLFSSITYIIMGTDA